MCLYVVERFLFLYDCVYEFACVLHVCACTLRVWLCVRFCCSGLIDVLCVHILKVFVCCVHSLCMFVVYDLCMLFDISYDFISCVICVHDVCMSCVCCFSWVVSMS